MRPFLLRNSIIYHILNYTKFVMSAFVEEMKGMVESTGMKEPTIHIREPFLPFLEVSHLVYELVIV